MAKGGIYMVEDMATSYDTPLSYRNATTEKYGHTVYWPTAHLVPSMSDNVQLLCLGLFAVTEVAMESLRHGPSMRRH